MLLSSGPLPSPGGLFFVLCFIRPRNPNVYAPRAKHADEKHALLPMSRKPFGWFRAIKGVKEQELVEKIGLEAVMFLRFLRMLRNIFIVLTIFGCGILIHVDVGTVCAFIFLNYRAVLKLRTYFNGSDYKSSLHSRTLLVWLTHIPEQSRSDGGIAQLVEEVKPTHDTPRTAIGRNVKDLPKLIKEHDDTVQELESYLAKYISEDDRATHGAGKVDAIDYLADRIARLEADVREVRESIDKRNPLPYGLASYTHTEDAHAVAYESRKKGPGRCDVYLGPKSHDLLWGIFHDPRVLLTIVFIVPNILTSDILQQYPTRWGIAQGILAPLTRTLMYLAIPIIFCRLYTHSGDVSKTSLERHVTSRLYAFFVFNNLVVFSVFRSAWRFPASQMQGNLGAAIDLIQAWLLIWGYRILSSPQPFEYADYYNNFLFVARVGLCFGTLRPIILPITAFYIGIVVWFKKYLLQYALITKTESGGRFWQFLVNRLLFAVPPANAVIALVIGAQGVGSINSRYCKSTFDDKLAYYTTEPFADLEGGGGPEEGKVKRNDNVGLRFGHPVPYNCLVALMIHTKSRHLLTEIYGHRSNQDRNIFEAEGHRDPTDRARANTPMAYSDMFIAEMDQVEIVAEQDLDFEIFKRRAGFIEEFGGDGELYGRHEDLISRLGTLSTFTTMTDIGFYGRQMNGSGGSTRNSSKMSLGDERVQDAEDGTSYSPGYQPTPRTDRFESVDVDIPAMPLVAEGIIDGTISHEDTSCEKYRKDGKC
ncbi:hypothetical protein K469DRAFT_731063 [Zopfia rhizophila CBS 207.26]|uniref:DUF221-domain-containing protein n=1 Tax=Zopfia rhizophila CBS 207.26 TaxID=1314779 RepID=A0A6A6EN07_9PEZI|nr:hypothetical protein K469DRAFT_731063 [Zopfia rhizophila CBS 207.26]